MDRQQRSISIQWSGPHQHGEKNLHVCHRDDARPPRSMERTSSCRKQRDDDGDYESGHDIGRAMQTYYAVCETHDFGGCRFVSGAAGSFVFDFHGSLWSQTCMYAKREDGLHCGSGSLRGRIANSRKGVRRTTHRPPLQALEGRRANEEHEDVKMRTRTAHHYDAAEAARSRESCT